MPLKGCHRDKHGMTASCEWLHLSFRVPWNDKQTCGYKPHHTFCSHTVLAWILSHGRQRERPWISPISSGLSLVCDRSSQHRRKAMCRTRAHRIAWLSAFSFCSVELHKVRSLPSDHNSELPFADQTKVDPVLSCVWSWSQMRLLHGFEATMSSFSSDGKQKGQAAKEGSPYWAGLDSSLD